MFKRKFSLNQKGLALLLTIKLILLLPKAKNQTTVVVKPKFTRHPHSAKAFSSPEQIYKNVKHHWKLTSLRVKVDKPKST